MGGRKPRSRGKLSAAVAAPSGSSACLPPGKRQRFQENRRDDEARVERCIELSFSHWTSMQRNSLTAEGKNLRQWLLEAYAEKLECQHLSQDHMDGIAIKLLSNASEFSALRPPGLRELSLSEELVQHLEMISDSDNRRRICMRTSRVPRVLRG